MAFEAIKAEIRDLLERSIDEPLDVHEMHMQLIERLNEMKATGMPLPDDLVRLERELTASYELAAAETDGLKAPPRPNNAKSQAAELLRRLMKYYSA